MKSGFNQAITKKFAGIAGANRVATGDSTWSCECSFRSDAVGRAAPSSSDPGAFFSLSLDQVSSLPAFPFMFAVQVGADCI